MKKILHLFSDRSHSALWSRYLRMLTLIALLAFGSHGVWGAELSGNLGKPADHGFWDSTNNKYSWDLSFDNLMDLFSGIDLTGKLGKDYAAIVFTTSGYTSGQEYRIQFKDVNNNNIATIVFYSDGNNKTVVFAEHKDTKYVDLSTVKFIKFGGNTSNGSITLDPSSIKLVGHKVTFSSNNDSQGTVSATYYGKEFKSGNAVAPNTQLTLIATPKENNLFWTWRQKVGNNYNAPWDGGYTAGFNSATSTATVTQDLDMQADFSSIWVKAVQQESDKEYGSVTIVKDGNDKGKEWHVTPWPGPTSFVATDGTKGFFVGWFTDPEYSTPAKTVTIEGKEYKSTDKTYITNEIGGSEFPLYAKFERGVQVNAKVEPSFLNPTIKIHQLNEPTWVISNGQYVRKYTTAVYNVDDINGYTFLGWYEGDTRKSTEKSYSLGNVSSDITLTAKFECNIKNNTQIVNLTNIQKPNNNVTAVSWDNTNKELSVTTKNNSNNVLYLTSITDANRGTGIRIHAKGAKYRVVVRLNNNDNNTKSIYINETTDGYVTRHYSWKDLGLTDDDIKNITDVGVAGNNTTTDETPYTFYVKYFWIDDIADYDHTIACYGEENGKYNYDNNFYTYSHTNDGVKAAFSGIGASDRITDTQSMKFKTGDANKLNISSANYNFSSIGLVFDKSTTYNLSIGGKTVSGTGVAVVVPVNSFSIDIINNGNNGNNGTEALSLAKITYTTGEAACINEKRTITVDGKERTYWIYAPGSVNGKQNVPVIFSLHGRQDKGADPDNTDAPKFKTVADSEDVIIVYPQGRHATDQGYPNRTENGQEVAWNKGYAGVYGWEATGKENADTKFIQALVDELKKNQFYNNTTVDPTRFYLCGFSMGGMMTYAIATALNDKKLFAAYASAGGFPVNEFHLNLATTMPVPFYHAHGKSDTTVKYSSYLPVIRENMLARYGCSLTPANTEVNGNYHHYIYRPQGKTADDRTFADLEYEEIDNLGHNVDQGRTPKEMWKFFQNYNTTDIYKDYLDAPEWSWDMTTINDDLSKETGHTEGHSVHGWSHYTNNTSDTSMPQRYLSYGEKKDNSNVYPAVQLKKGKHVLYVKAKVAKNNTTDGYVSIKIKNNSTGVDIVARKLTNNSGKESVEMNMIYEFETFDEDAEYTIINSRSHDSGTECTVLAIYRKGYAPTGETDHSQDNFKPDVESGKVIEITFDNPTLKLEKLSGYNNADFSSSTRANLTNNTDSYLFYYANRLNTKYNNEDQKVLKTDDAVFGTYFQNMPHADIFERTSCEDYMRIVIPDSKVTELYEQVKASGQITIGFWVNAKLAVDRKLSYREPSIFYLAGNTFNGPNADNSETSKHLFGIKGNGGISGYMSDKVNYSTGGAFGDFCYNGDDKGQFYKSNFYFDGNWHYITYQMYDNLTKYKMYIDAFPANGGYATISDLEELKNLHSIVLGGLNAKNVTYSYDVPFAYDDIVIYSRMLSQADIKKIVSDKQYTPSWNFSRDLTNDNLFDATKLNSEWWTDNEDGTYTLKKSLTTAANLTYNGNEVIPAFRGMQFTTNAENQIIIDKTNGNLQIMNGVTMIFTNIPVGNSLRYETANNITVGTLTNVTMGSLKDRNNHKCTAFTVDSGTDGFANPSIQFSADATIYSISRTDKKFITLNYYDASVIKTKYESDGTPGTPADLPKLKYSVNGGEKISKQSGVEFKYSSSAPHVAYVGENSGTVTITGIPGSAVITAELKNDGSYDTSYDDKDNPYTLFEDQTRVFTTYEIITKPKEDSYKKFVVNKDATYTVDQKLDSDIDKNVIVTLGGWHYGGTDTKDGATDTYYTPTEWKGFTCRDLTANSNFGVFQELYDNTVTNPISTNGSRASKSELWSKGDGLYKANKENTVTNNSTPWTLPCRGSHIKVEPIKPGIVTVYVMQEGCVTRNAKKTEPDAQETEPDTQGKEPDAVQLSTVYITDETGKSIREVACDTKTRIADQIWKNDGRARAEYNWGDVNVAYNKDLYDTFLANINDEIKWAFLDNWENPGMKQHVFCVDFYDANEGMGIDGHAIITKGVVRYTFNVLPGKTYYIFSNHAPIGLAGFSFYEGQHINFVPVKERKYTYWRANATEPLTPVKFGSDIKIVDGVDENDISKFTVRNNATIEYTRTFTKGKWAGLCLPYSISNRQMKDQFGEGTQVILLNKIYDKDGHGIVHFIWHPNQDIIAGYPYLILPSKTTNSIKTNSYVAVNTPSFFVKGDNGGSSFDYESSHLGDGNNSYSLGTNVGYIFAGNFKKITVPEKSYVISNGILKPAASGVTLKPFRAYLHNTAGAQAKVLKSMAVSGWDDLDDLGNTTSIDEILEENGIFTRGANVYDLNGVLVRKNTHTIQGLPKGIYVVNGKKYVVK